MPAATAAQALYERHGRKILAFCLHRLGNREEAEDAVQTTFLNAFRSLQRGVEPEVEAAWLFKIAENVCLSRQRSSSRRRRLEAPADLHALQDVVPSRAGESDELFGLTEALGAMPAQQRRALLLREWHGLSYAEIAGELELSQSAVETLLFRARRSLARGLEQPPERRPRRIRLRAGELGSALTVLKTLLLGSSAKVAATVATVAVTSVAVAPPARHELEHAVASGAGLAASVARPDAQSTGRPTTPPASKPRPPVTKAVGLPPTSDRSTTPTPPAPRIVRDPMPLLSDRELASLPAEKVALVTPTPRAHAPAAPAGARAPSSEPSTAVAAVRADDRKPASEVGTTEADAKPVTAPKETRPNEPIASRAHEKAVAAEANARGGNQTAKAAGRKAPDLAKPVAPRPKHASHAKRHVRVNTEAKQHLRRVTPTAAKAVATPTSDVAAIVGPQDAAKEHVANGRDAKQRQAEGEQTAVVAVAPTETADPVADPDPGKGAGRSARA
jgi:RNA polymerase sigma-70 factor, ECF subfamily